MLVTLIAMLCLSFPIKSALKTEEITEQKAKTITLLLSSLGMTSGLYMKTILSIKHSESIQIGKEVDEDQFKAWLKKTQIYN